MKRYEDEIMYPFPPDRVEPLGPYVVYPLIGVSLAAFLWAIVCAFRRGPDAARWSDLAFWAVAAAFPSGLAMRGTTLNFRDYRPYGVIEILLCWCAAAAVVGGTLTAVRILSQQRARTFLDLLVVAVVGVLFVAVLTPSVSTMREEAGRTRCRKNLKQIGLAFHNYHEAYARFPTAGDRRADLSALSWRVSLLPFLDESGNGLGYRRDEPWDSPNNRAVAREPLAVYQCPSRRTPARSPSGDWYTDYVVLTGSGTIFPAGGGIRMADIKDGSSNTILAIEAAGTEIAWTEPRDLSVESLRWRVNAPGDRPGTSRGIASSFHGSGAALRGSGASVLMADGSVRHLSEATSGETLQRLSDVSGGSLCDNF